MKNKSARHKNENTFKFQPFSERIANIDVDVFHRVEHEYETESEENECYFYRAIEKWSVLNLTEGYTIFCREIKPRNAITLPLLINCQEHIIETLLKHLKLKDPLYIQPLLDITVAVAKDLQKDFYVYYPKFLEVLIELLHTKDTDQLEYTFTCLAYLFKILWRPLIKDINSVFVALLPLLSDSQPDYVNNFAAESFAFVARKVKDKRGFLNLLLKAVKNQNDGVVGCGMLLFEVIHGIDGQFHSTATTMLPFLLESLSDEKLPTNILFEILEQVIKNIVLNIHYQKTELLWTTFLAQIEKLNTQYIRSKEGRLSENLEQLLKLLGQTIEYKNGKLLQNVVPVVQLLVTLLDNEFPESTMKIIVQISISLVLCKNIKLPQEHNSSIIRKVLSINNRKLLLYYVDNVNDCLSFDLNILPFFLKFCLSNNFDDDCFHVLTKLCLKKSKLCENGIEYLNWKPYSLDFGTKVTNNKVFEFLEKNINIEDIDKLLENFDNYFCSLVCLPHIVNSTETNNIMNILDNNLKLLIKKIKINMEDKSQLKKVTFLLQITLECSGHFGKSLYLIDNIEENLDILLPIVTELSQIGVLKCLSLLIAILKDEKNVINLGILQKINKHMEVNFNSPYHEMRLLTTHIYTFFEAIPEFKLKHSDDPEVPVEDFKVFSLCYRTESIDPQVDTYRDQLLALEKLNFGKPQMIMCNQTEFKTIPLRYLCGCSYMNFQLLWDPISKMVETHAHGLEINTFWQIFGNELKSVNQNIDEQQVVNTIDVIQTKCDFLGDLYQDSQKIISKPDFINHRLLLWKSMTEFADIAEAKTRDVAELLLNFIEKEYSKSNAEMGLTCSIKQNAKVEVEEEIEENSDEIKNTKTKGNARTNLKSLLHMLTVFSKVKSPKSMYREPDLYKLYFELLQHHNAEVQKAALDCIMTYKFKYLTPYKENLYNLIDEKNFKSEITAFRIDKDSTVVLTEHRENLVPIVMQIVFSKMHVKTGLRTGGKASGQHRRNLVFRFLAGCQENEMLNFVQKSFRNYLQYLKEDPQEMCSSIVKNVELEKFIPPKRLQSTLNLLNVVLEQFGGLMGNETLNFLLNIIMTIGSFVKSAFDKFTEVHVGYFSMLKTARATSIKLIERFFEHFDRFPWTSQQINAIFDVFVWPYLEKLNIEGIHSPTALLKLICQWGSNPRYFSLLVKHEENNETQFILPHVVNLLVNVKSHGSVVNTILEMVEKLLSLQPDEEDMENQIPVEHLLPVAQNILDRISQNDKLNYGSCILLPHVPIILQIIKRKLEGKNKSLNTRELFILSRISELVWEADISDTILRLLLPVVLKKSNSGEEVLQQFLNTIKNLVNNISDPSVHLKQISPLFGDISFPSCRKILINVLRIITSKCDNEKLKTSVHLIEDLNSWDAKWIDQPDFEKRHNAFLEVQSYIESNEIDLSLGILLIYNSLFLVKNERDLSLRENSSHLLKTLCPVLIKQHSHPKEVEYILNDTIFNAIRAGFKSKNDDYRYLCISLLGHLSRECPNSHFILRDLNKYTNKADLEVDMFENLTHLQIHRHARALLRFCQITKEQVVSQNPRSLTQFILPLATFYLCSEKFAGKNSIIDAAIEAIGTVCRILPWHQYEGLLKFYLNKLRGKIEYQKQLVRLTVAILDSFHFDLTKGHIEESKDKSRQEETSEIKTDEVNVETKLEQEEITGIKASETNVENEESDIDEELMIEEGTIQDQEDEEEGEQNAKPYEKITVLCKSTATRVIQTIQMVLLPQLHKSLAFLTQHDSSHKVNRKKTGFEREEEDLLRVPISLAVVKLLQRLPKQIMEINLPGVFMKLCTFLKSQMESVRRVARETLQKIMTTLGPKYLSILLGEMAPLLSRGFHAHVLVFTTHGVLSCLKEYYEPTDIDKVLLTVVDLCKADLFGQLAEEKEVSKIVVKTSEAKSTKSFDTFQILAQFITEKCLMDLILPIKNVLETTHSFKTVHKAQESLRYISLGLVDNTFISLESLLKFAYGTASERIPQLAPAKKPKLTEKERELKQRTREDCLIIPEMPKSRTAFRENSVKSSSSVNAHLIVEFGLRLCFSMLKREKIKDEQYKSFVDPFVSIFVKCLKSKHVKLCTLTLQCLSWLLKYDLPSMKENVKIIAKEMFGILHKYAAAGLSKGDNFDLVVATFKAMSVLVRDVKHYTVDTKQLKALLLYAEQDMHDHNRQATAFNLLKAIIARKLIVPEIHEVMSKVAELSITSELDHVRSQARMVFHQFLMDYPMGSRLETHLGFYVSQMSYEMQYGRESAIEMVQTLIHSFPIGILKEHSGMLLVTLGARLVNDEVPECRKKIANCIISMLSKLPKPERQPLFEIVSVWLSEKHTGHRRLAAQLCGFFVTVEKEDFESRLNGLMPLIMKQFGLDESVGKFVKINKPKEDKDTEEHQRVNDHHLFQVYQLLLKICSQCPSFLKRKDDIENLAIHTQKMLAYPHDWVRLAAAQFLGFVLSTMDIDQLANLLANNESLNEGYLCKDPINSVKSLTLDLCDQLMPGGVKSDLAEQVIKNLVFIARVLQKVRIKDQEHDQKINLVWLTKRMRKIVNSEIVENASNTVLRNEVFKWIAGVTTALELDNIRPVVHHLLAPLVREMITTEEKNAPLRQLAKEVANLLKKKFGMEEYTKTLSNLQQTLSVKRAERKRARTQLAVTDPEMFAKKKIKRHEKKKESKKRKIAEMKGKPKTFKKRKTVDLEDNSECM